MEQGNKDPQTLATTGLVYVPNNGTKRNNNGTNHYLKRKGHQTMKIKLFTRELVLDGTNGLGFQAFKPEPDKEFETRINDFMIDKKVVSVQSLKDSVFVTYTD